MTLSAPAETAEAKSHALYPLAMAAAYVLAAGLLGLLAIGLVWSVTQGMTVPGRGLR